MALQEHIRAYHREYARRYRAKHADYRKRSAILAREWQKRNPVRYSWNNARQSARKRGYEWTLSPHEYEALVLMKCFYCDADPSPINGVDRIDNSKGYVHGNVTSACTHCNFAKRGMRSDEFIAWARRVVLHNQPKE